MDANGRTNWSVALLLIRSAGPVLAVIFRTALGAQYVVPVPGPGCLLPQGTALIEIFVTTGPCVGVVYQPPVHTAVNAYLAPDTKEWVRTALAGTCATEAGADPIALHIKRVTLAESGSDQLVRSGAFVDLEVLAWSNDQWRIRCSVPGEVIQKTEPNDDGRHARYLIDALQDAMTKYATARAADALTDMPFAIGVRSGRVAYPIEKMHGLPPGVFWTADDFRHGRLARFTDTTFVVDRYGDLRMKAELRQGHDRVFAVSDGSHYYVRWKEKFRRLVWDGTHFTSTASRVHVSTGASIAFGLMGAALSARRVHIPLQMDLEEGELNEVSLYATNETVKHRFLFDMSESGDQRLAVRVWDDRIMLEPGAYCELFYPAYSGVELVRIMGPVGTLELTVDANAVEGGLHVLQLDAEGRPVLKELTPEEKEVLRGTLQPSMLRHVVE